MNDKAECGVCCRCCGCSCRVCVVCGETRSMGSMKATDCDAFVCRDGDCAEIHDECCGCKRSERGIEIEGMFVSFDELRADVAAAKAKGLRRQWAFCPETVEALLNWIAEHQGKVVMV